MVRGFSRIQMKWSDSEMKWFKRFVMFFKSKKKEYNIISCGSRFDLSDHVNKALTNGWDVCGGVGYMAVKTGGNQYDHKQVDVWFQSMTRET